MRRLALFALLIGTACSAGERWTYRTPAVVDEAALLAELRPKHPGELVLANFWASW